MRLEQLKEAYPTDPVMRAVAYREHQKLLREGMIPLTGIYWIYPAPVQQGIEWRLASFFDKDYGDTQHDRLWIQCLSLIAAAWRKSESALINQLRNDYSGLPRGRVNKVQLGVNQWGFNVYHGNDAPLAFKRLITREFGLTRANPQFVFDNHERIQVSSLKSVERALGLSLNLKSV